MTFKQLILSLFIILITIQISYGQQWVYNASGTQTKGSYRYASLTSAAHDNPRSSSIYINYYNLDRKYNIYLYEITGLECSDNKVEFFTDVNKTPQSFTVSSKSDGIETIAMTEVEDLTAFFNTLNGSTVLTISISNTCGTGRDILFPMSNAADVVTFMFPNQVQEQEQVLSSSVNTEQKEEIDHNEAEHPDSKAQIQEQASSSNVYHEQSVVSTKPELKQHSKITPSPHETDTDAEWTRLTKRNKELDRKDSLLVVFQAQLDERELALIQLEQELKAKVKQTLSTPPVVNTSTTTSNVAPSTSTTTVPTSTVVPTTSYPYRYVQFVATTAGRSYDQLNYIGQIISEQIPGKNITRYKVMGQWSDADIARVKTQLAQEGFKGAFESR